MIGFTIYFATLGVRSCVVAKFISSELIHQTHDFLQPNVLPFPASTIPLSFSGWRRLRRPGHCASRSKALSVRASLCRRWQVTASQWLAFTVTFTKWLSVQWMMKLHTNHILKRPPITPIGLKPGKRWPTVWKWPPTQRPLEILGSATRLLAISNVANLTWFLQSEIDSVSSTSTLKQWNCVACFWSFWLNRNVADGTFS